MNPSRSSIPWTRGRPRAWWAVALLSAAAFAWPMLGQSAQLRRQPLARPAGIVEQLPADLQMVLCINDAARQFQSAPGRAITGAVASSRLFADTAAAWMKLAALLQWKPDDAFRRLAGRRLVLVLTAPDADRHRSWAVLSDVDEEAEAALLKALQAAPRQTICGQPVRSLEDGRFELAIFHHPDAKKSKLPAPCTLVLVPDTNGDLLERIVKGLAGAPPGPTLADAPGMNRAKPFLAGDIFFMAAPDEKAADERFILSAALAADGWNARFTASPGMLLGREAQALPDAQEIGLWSADAVTQLSSRAMAVVMSDELLGLDRWMSLLSVPTLPEGAADRLRGLLGRRTFLGVFRAPPDKGDAVDRFILACGFDAPDIDLLSAPADAVMGRLIGAMKAGAGAAESDRPDFQGFLPWAPRVVPFTGQAAELWAPLLGVNPDLTWVYRAGPKADGAAPASGWWLVTLSPSGRRPPASDWAVDVCERLTRPDPASARRPRVSAGFVRIGELVRWVADKNADPKGSLSPLQCIDTARWDAWLAPSGQVEGTIGLTTVPPR